MQEVFKNLSTFWPYLLRFSPFLAFESRLSKILQRHLNGNIYIN